LGQRKYSILAGKMGISFFKNSVKKRLGYLEKWQQVLFLRQIACQFISLCSVVPFRGPFCSKAEPILALCPRYLHTAIRVKKSQQIRPNPVILPRKKLHK
jgi:hypothetical protein